MLKRAGNQFVVEFLISAGRNVNEQQEITMETALHKAARKGQTQLVDLLLKNGANTDNVNRNGETPLHLGAIMGHQLVVNSLLEAGAEVNNFKWSQDTYKLVPEDQRVRPTASRKVRNCQCLISLFFFLIPCYPFNPCRLILPHFIWPACKGIQRWPGSCLSKERRLTNKVGDVNGQHANMQ